MELFIPAYDSVSLETVQWCLLASEVSYFKYSVVTIVRVELRQQVDKLTASNEVLKSSNEALSNDVSLLGRTVQQASHILSMYFWIISMFFLKLV